MSIDPQILFQFDQDNDFSARMAKIDYILEYGTEQEINRYLDRAYQEASIQWLMIIANDLTPGDPFTISLGDAGNITITKPTSNPDHPEIFIYPAGARPGLGIRIDADHNNFQSASRYLNRLGELIQGQRRGMEQSVYEGERDHWNSTLVRHENVSDVLKIPLFNEVDIPTNRKQPKPPKGPTDASQP